MNKQLEKYVFVSKGSKKDKMQLKLDVELNFTDSSNLPKVYRYFIDGIFIHLLQ